MIDARAGRFMGVEIGVWKDFVDDDPGELGWRRWGRGE